MAQFKRLNETLLEQYTDKIWPEIYIHGDGANWLKSGLSWLPKSHFVLDKFHAFQYLKKIAPPDSEDYHYLKSCMLSNRKKDFSKRSEEVAGKYGYQIEETLRARQYILNNWSGIIIWTRDKESGSSCAEGLVSHCLSEHFSMAPMTWMDSGVRDIGRLREYRLNGGTVSRRDFSKEGEKDRLIEVAESVKLIAIRKEPERKFDFAGMPTAKLMHCKRDSHFRLFDRIKNGGMRLDYRV